LLAHAVNNRADALQIRIPTAAAGVVRVADHVAETRPLAAKRASHCHIDSSPILLILKMLSKVNSLAEFHPLRTSFGRVI
jgi:hypothetical protein